MITLKHTDRFTGCSIIWDIMKIEKEVYPESYQGEYESICQRFEKYPEMFLLAYDEEKLVGYFCYFPISHSLYEEIVIHKNFHDDDILPKDIVPFSANGHLYLLSIAIYKAYQDIGIADSMMKEFEKIIYQEMEKGKAIEDVITSTVTEDGERLVSRYSYKLHYDKSKLNGFKVYRKIYGGE